MRAALYHGVGDVRLEDVPERLHRGEAIKLMIDL